MITETASVDTWGHKIVAESVHHQKRCQAGGISEVVPKVSLCQGWAGTRLDGDSPQLFPMDLISKEGEGDTSEVGPTSTAADDNIGILINCGNSSMLVFRSIRPTGVTRGSLVAAQIVPAASAESIIVRNLCSVEGRPAMRAGDSR